MNFTKYLKIIMYYIRYNCVDKEVMRLCVCVCVNLIIHYILFSSKTCLCESFFLVSGCKDRFSSMAQVD